tara:strand:- start:180 stop:656 length:477 start_codon:yes stop_codon:yes gene_type:complete
MVTMTTELQIQKEVFALSNIINLIDEAARTERFLSGPKPPMAASMYNLLETTYMQGDWAYYEKKLLKLRATPKQITRWEFAIECLTSIEHDISEDPILDRQIIWMKAQRFKWTEIAKHFGFTRHQIKNRYMKVLSKLCSKFKNNNKKYCKLNRILYLI